MDENEDPLFCNKIISFVFLFFVFVFFFFWEGPGGRPPPSLRACVSLVLLDRLLLLRLVLVFTFWHGCDRGNTTTTSPSSSFFIQRWESLVAFDIRFGVVNLYILSEVPICRCFCCCFLFLVFFLEKFWVAIFVFSEAAWTENFHSCFFLVLVLWVFDQEIGSRFVLLRLFFDIFSKLCYLFVVLAGFEVGAKCLWRQAFYTCL